MKALLLVNSFRGLYSFRREIVECLLAHGYSVFIAGPHDDCTTYFRSIGCEIYNTKVDSRGTNPLNDLALLFSYFYLVKQILPAIVLSYTIKPNLYGGLVCRLYRIPQIANVTGLGTAVETPGLTQRIAFILYRIGLKKARAVFFQNEDSCSFCIKHSIVNPHAARIIPGSGVNLTWHSVQPYPNDVITRFIYIGRVLKEKGIDQFLEAAMSITTRYPNTEFCVMGGCGNDYAARLSQLSNDGIISYIGRQNDVRPFIGQSHCTILPSYYPEGMNNALLESCAAGRPIITTDRPGCREIVEDGKTGFIVRQKDTKDLIEKIERFIHLSYEEKKEMGIAARLKVEREFNRETVVDAYLDLINQITGNV